MSFSSREQRLRTQAPERIGGEGRLHGSEEILLKDNAQTKDHFPGTAEQSLRESHAPMETCLSVKLLTGLSKDHCLHNYLPATCSVSALHQAHLYCLDLVIWRRRKEKAMLYMYCRIGIGPLFYTRVNKEQLHWYQSGFIWV